MSKASIAGLVRETDLRYRSLFFTEWETRLNEVMPLVEETDLDGTDRYRVGELFAGITTAPQKAEGSEYDYYAPQEGNDVIVTTDIYKFAFKATEELRKYGRSRQIFDYPRIQAEILDHTIKVMVYNMFNRAFSSSYPTLYDGVEMCGTHTLANGGSFANELSSGADPSETTLESLIEVLTETPNEDGVYIGRAPRVYMASNSNWATLTKVTGSPITTLQGTGESGNAINAVASAWGIMPHFSPYLTDDNASFVLGDRSPVRLVWALRPQMKPVYVDRETDDWIWPVKMQVACIMDTWRGVAGTGGSS